MLGLSMNRFSDWLWSMKAPRAAAMSMSARWGSSHAVRYTERRSSGISAMACTEPSAILILLAMASLHRPRCCSSRTR